MSEIMKERWQCNACKLVYDTEAEAAGCPCPMHTHARTQVLMRAGFEQAFASWLRGCQRIVDDYMAQHFPSNPPQFLTAQPGKKRIRVCNDHSAWAFVDLETGDVLKPASWATPAKHARGNIFDEKNGLGSITWTGPAYLR